MNKCSGLKLSINCIIVKILALSVENISTWGFLLASIHLWSFSFEKFTNSWTRDAVAKKHSLSALHQNSAWVMF